jgi:hypothetical protein
MLGTIWDGVVTGAKLAYAWLTFQTQKDVQKNAPEMKANAAAGTATAQADQAAADVKAGTEGNLDQLRKDAAQ